MNYTSWKVTVEERGGVRIEIMPEWLAGLEDEDVGFIRNFVLSSGSLKEIAKIYGVTYPTVRLRLDRLIEKIRISEDEANEPYVLLIKRLAVSGRLDYEVAKLLIAEYRRQNRKGEHTTWQWPQEPS